MNFASGMGASVIGRSVPGSKEEDFGSFTIDGHGDKLGHATPKVQINFLLSDQKKLHVKFDSEWPGKSVQTKFLVYTIWKRVWND